MQRDNPSRLSWRVMAVFAGIPLSIVLFVLTSSPVWAGLTACDPGYEFTVHNPCDARVTVDLRDSDDFGRSGTGGAVALRPHSTTSWSMIDPHINPPFGVLLLDGPREGELIKSETAEVTIPESGCPR